MSSRTKDKPSVMSAGAPGFLPARRRDLAPLLGFLVHREWRSVAFTSRLKGPGGPRLPPRSEAEVFLFRSGGKVRGALLRSSGGLLLPVLDDIPPAESDLLPDLNLGLHSVMGPERDVGWMEKAADLKLDLRVEYHLMTLNRDRFNPSPAGETGKEAAGLAVRRAGPRDLDRLFPLQKLYELEEVVLDPGRYHERAAYQGFRQSLDRQITVMAELDGKIVAKAGTNARGFHADQVGGVFTLPEARNRGIGRRVMLFLLELLFRDKRSVCLFVKRSNPAAISLYRRCGFSTTEGYCIAYHREGE